MYYTIGEMAKLLNVTPSTLRYYNADGGDCTVVNLPKVGITGNSHFMFQEMNNKEIAEHIELWLKERGLN